MDRKSQKVRLGRLKWVSKINTLTAVILFFLLVAMCNYLSYRHYTRADISESKYYKLSGKTLSLLESLTNDVSITVFFEPGQAVYEDIRNLLREYEYACKYVNVEWVDPHRDLARTEELVNKYDIGEVNVVVFESQGRSKYVTSLDIADFDLSMVRYGGRPRMTAFKGEQAFSTAIQSVTQGRKPVVYFLQGHGEGDIEEFDRRKGFSALARKVRHDNIEVKTLVFGEEHTVPADCDALIIAGPKKSFSPPEVELLRSYLDRNGRMLLLLDARVETGLEPLLKEWGVNLREDLVVDANRTLTGLELFITEYEDHPITKRLKGVTSILYMPRSVEPLENGDLQGDLADKPHVTVLASSSETGWAETQQTDGMLEFDPLTDIPGPVPVAVAIEKGPVPGIDVQIRPTRMVIFGDSDFVSNAALTGGDIDFFMSALNWLLERKELMAITPKAVQESRLVMSNNDLTMMFFAVVIGLPAVVALLGGFVWARRRQSVLRFTMVVWGVFGLVALSGGVMFRAILTPSLLYSVAAWGLSGVISLVAAWMMGRGRG